MEEGVLTNDIIDKFAKLLLDGHPAKQWWFKYNEERYCCLSFMCCITCHNDFHTCLPLGTDSWMNYYSDTDSEKLIEEKISTQKFVILPIWGVSPT